MANVLLKPYADLYAARSSLEQRNLVMADINNARDAQQRIVGFNVCEAVPELRNFDYKTIRAWVDNHNIIIDDCNLLPILADKLDHKSFISVFWEIISPTFVNICQPIPMLYLAYTDFCDICGRKTKLSKRHFVDILSDVVVKEWLCPIDADGSLSRVNPYMWVLGREKYIEALLSKCDAKFGKDVSTAESISNWLPPFGDRKRISKGGAFYLRCVYEWCHANMTTPRQAIESKWKIVLPEPNYDETRPWKYDEVQMQYWRNYTEELSNRQEKLIKFAKRNRV